jgi:hypothetical protein
MLQIRNWDTKYETYETRRLKRLEWVCVRNDLLDLGYRTLIDHADGAAHLGAWLAIVEIGSRCQARGKLVENGIPLTAKHLAIKSGLPEGLFRAAIPRLLDASIGWLEESGGGIAGTPADSTGISVVPGKTSGRIEGNGMEGKGRENICASDDARLCDPPLSIDQPPFETTEPDALFPTEKKKKRAKAIVAMTAQQEAWFIEWWDAYWLHKAKLAAREAFSRHVLSEARFQQVLAATRAQAPEMLAREPQHRPHGATWLNQERWEDEADMPATQQARPDVFAQAVRDLHSEETRQ